MFENLEEKQFSYFELILYLFLLSIVFTISSALIAGQITWSTILDKTLIPLTSAIIGMAIPYYFINDKSFGTIGFNKFILVPIIGFIPSVIVGIALAFIL